MSLIRWSLARIRGYEYAFGEKMIDSLKENYLWFAKKSVYLVADQHEIGGRCSINEFPLTRLGDFLNLGGKS